MKFLILSTLVGSMFTLTGCTNSVLGTLLAPESVVGGAATDLAEAGAETLSGASLDELTNSGSTVAELDRILMDNPNAVNADRLRNLRDQIETTSTTEQNNQLAKINNSTEGRRNHGRSKFYGREDYLSVKKLEDESIKKRRSTYPNTIPMGWSIYEEYQAVHFMNFNSIRLR